MTDPGSCPNCGTALPDGAAFCTNCGSKVDAGGASATGASATPVSSSVADDVTRVETPGLHDATQVLPTPPLAHAPESGEPTLTDGGSEAPPWVPPAPPPQAPWQPPSTDGAPPRGAQPGAWQPGVAQGGVAHGGVAPPGVAQSGAWQPPPPPPPDWAQRGPASGQAWPPPSAPSAPPGQWQQTASGPWPPGGAAPAAVASRPRTGAGLAAALAFLGAILLVVSVFGLWLQSATASVAKVKLTGWEMVTKKDKAGALRSPDPAILLAIAAASIAVGGLLIAGKTKILMRALLALAGIGAMVVFVRDYLSIKEAVKHNFDSTTTIDFKYGFWVGAAGAAILLVAAAVPPRRHS